jgi:phage gp45-like
MCSILVVAWDTNVKTAFEDIECSTAVMFDDIINGNVSFDGDSFFIGVETLGTELGKVNGNISNLETEMDTISSDGSTMASLYTDIDSALTEI